MAPCPYGLLWPPLAPYILSSYGFSHLSGFICLSFAPYGFIWPSMASYGNKLSLMGCLGAIRTLVDPYGSWAPPWLLFYYQFGSNWPRLSQICPDCPWFALICPRFALIGPDCPQLSLIGPDWSFMYLKETLLVSAIFFGLGCRIYGRPENGELKKKHM